MLLTFHDIIKQFTSNRSNFQCESLQKRIIRLSENTFPKHVDDANARFSFILCQFYYNAAQKFATIWATQLVIEVHEIRRKLLRNFNENPRVT